MFPTSIITAIEPIGTTRHCPAKRLKDAECNPTINSNEYVALVSPHDMIPQQLVSDQNEAASTSKIAFISSYYRNTQAITTSDDNDSSDENSVLSDTSTSNKRKRLDEQTIPGVSESALEIQCQGVPTLSQRDSGVTSKAENTSTECVKVIRVFVVL